jgi:hypothetical protein
VTGSKFKVSEEVDTWISCRAALHVGPFITESRTLNFEL